MTEGALFDILRAWLASATGLATVIEDHPGAPRPSGAYVMVNVIRSGPLHPEAFDRQFAENPAYEVGDDFPILDRPVGEWEWTASINVYASDAGDRLRRVTMWAASPGAIEKLHPLVLGPLSAIRRLPELINGKWEGRAQLDMSIRGIVTDDVPIDVIEKVVVDFGVARNVDASQEPQADDHPFGSAVAGSELVAAPTIAGVVTGELDVQFAEGDIAGEGFPGATVTIEL